MTTRPNKQQAILVLGMHRSGTSAATRMINLLGAELNSKMLLPSQDNPKGFWESAEAIEIHERLFTALSRTWYDMHTLPADWLSHPAAIRGVSEIVELVRRDFSGTPLWAIKDPRMCLLVPLWLEALASLDIDVKMLFVVRNPIEVSESLRVRNLRERNQWKLGHAAVMWAQYLAIPEAATRGTVRAMLTYDELLADWRTVMARVADDLDIAWPHSSDEAGAEIDDFLEHGERHHNVRFEATDALQRGVPDLVVRMYQECIAITRHKKNWNDLAPLADEYFRAADFYSEALDNLIGYYQAADVLAAQSEDSRVHAEDALGLRTKELENYERQAQEYDELLRNANRQIGILTKQLQGQAETYERELSAYEKQARTYDHLLKEANGRVESLTKELHERDDAYGQVLSNYEKQAQVYAELLRDANSRAESLTIQLQEHTAAYERDLSAYEKQAQIYDGLLREANDGQVLSNYEKQAQVYAELLRDANSRAESLTTQLQEHTAAYERDLSLYEKQAQIYDGLLREANDRLEDLTKQIRG